MISNQTQKERKEKRNWSRGCRRKLVSEKNLTLKLSFWNASRSWTWTLACWKLFPGAKWKFPATLLTSKNPYTLHPSPSSSFILCRKPSRLHWWYKSINIQSLYKIFTISCRNHIFIILKQEVFSLVLYAIWE